MLGDGDWIVEERLDMSQPLPLKGLGPQDDEKIAIVNKLGLPKELRAYSFGKDSSGKLATNFVMRASNKGDTHLDHDSWVYLDPDSVPAVMVEQTSAVMEALGLHTGIKEIHAATDWVYASSRSSPDAHWPPMEINATEPQLVFEQQHTATARLQVGMLADQMLRIASKTK